jgi:hypothetical protein
MKVNDLIKELQRMKDNGYGENQVVIWATDMFNKDHHTTVEETNIVNASWDKNKKVIVLLP